MGPSDQRLSSGKVPRRRSSGLKFFTSSAALKPEVSKESHKTWEAEYLKGLRADRPVRPGGSRPLPERAASSIPEPYVRASSAMSFRPGMSNDMAQEKCTSALSHQRAQSYLLNTVDGFSQPPVRHPASGESSQNLPSPSAVTEAAQTIPSGTYRESGMRWLEKQEARSLREALEDMDMRDEKRIHAAAQDEASDLVQKHRNNNNRTMSSYKPYTYNRQQIGAHTRSQTLGSCQIPGVSDIRRGIPEKVGSIDPSSTLNNASRQKGRKTSITFEIPARTAHISSVEDDQGHALWDSPQKKKYMNLSSPKLPAKPSGHRLSGGLRARQVSGGLFRNPDDKIYEEPDSSQRPHLRDLAGRSQLPAPLISKTQNVISRIPTNSRNFSKSRRTSFGERHATDRSEIHKNPPSQSRDPIYLRNEEIRPPSHNNDEPKNTEVSVEGPHMKDGREIRSDDIRAATSMRLKDRSPKLPSPTVVSNRPGRPIVSFDKDWKPKDSERQRSCSPTPASGINPRARFKPQMPESSNSAPIVPTINIPDPPPIEVSAAPQNQSSSIPSISITGMPAPSISLPDESPNGRPLPSPSTISRPSPANRPLPRHSSTTPVHSSRLHWSPSSRRATAQCAACALPIEGRIVSAASQRFHPHCFTCHHCAEALECVAFYPEPDSAKDARLSRIEARTMGTLEDEKPGETALDDGDPSPHFYCHLDFHELFSPRCRSCKTPIETEVVIACGASWHVGHFFCAQCGDPFDANTPFVEKDGYAWCVGCHAGRFSGKCKGCRKPVVEGGVEALGGEWHVECFSCIECGGEFTDGRFFTRGDEEKPVCVKCEEKRLKA